MTKQLIILYVLIISLMAGAFVFYIEVSFAQQMGYCEMGMPDTLNPLFMEDPISFRFADLLYSRLLKKDIYNVPQPHLLSSLDPIESIDSNGFSIRKDERENGLKYTFRLKNNISWHPQAGIRNYNLTAIDVAFTFRMIKDSQYPTRYDHIKMIIENIVALSDNIIEVTLVRKAPKEVVLSNLHFYILPAHCFPSNLASINPEDNFGRKLIIGTGLYRFWKKMGDADAIFLQQNKDYFQGWPKMERPNRPIEYIKMQKVDDEIISVALIKAGGEIQLIPDTRPTDWIQLANPKIIYLQEYDARGYMAIAYNCIKPPFDNQKVRQALTYATDSEEMLGVIYGKDIDKTKIISGPFPPGEGDENIKPYRAGIEKARALNIARDLLKEAGFRDTNGDGILDRNGKPFEFQLKTYIKRKDEKRVCERYQSQLSEIGVHVEIKYYRNQEVDKLAKENETELDPDKRVQNNSKLHRILHEESPYTFLFSVPKKAAIRKNILSVAQVDSYYFFTHITQWYLMKATYTPGTP
ncbi:MAG: ABC transporter substrate-binding protein [Planctomycetota bacterium]|jgi:peptide/nickel transport system substrate-binding protein